MIDTYIILCMIGGQLWPALIPCPRPKDVRCWVVGIDEAKIQWAHAKEKSGFIASVVTQVDYSFKVSELKCDKEKR